MIRFTVARVESYQKINAKSTYLLNKNRLTDIENRLVVGGGRVGEGMNGNLGLAETNYYI